MATEFDDFDQFRNHKGGGSGGGGRRLKGWKEKGKLDAWLHTKRLPVGVWRHSFPQLIVKEDRDTRVVTNLIFPVSLVCHEDESVLKEQYSRTPDDEREVPPVTCPMCKMIEHVRGMVERGDLKWTDPLFEFKGAVDSRQNTVIRAGGLFNAFGSKKLSDAQKSDMKKHGVYGSEAWKQNAMAKLSYVFPIVDNNDISAGVQVTTESALLKEKVVSVINKEMESDGTEDGNPVIRPYCIRFVYREDATDFKEKYDALPLRKVSLTEEIGRLIRAEPPDLAMFTDPFNASTLRSNVERHALVDLPWDDFFGDVQPEESEPPPESDHDLLPKNRESEQRPAAKTEAKPKAEPKTGSRKRTPAPPKDEMGDPCDDCGAPMGKRDSVCKKCGAKYEVDASTSEIPF